MLGKKHNPDATAAMKALTIYSLLIFSGRRYSHTELTKLLGCSKPTVTRLLRQIEVTPGLHVKIDVEEEGREYYYRAVRPESKPNVSLETKAIQDLALCRDMLTHLLPPQLCQEIGATINQTAVLLDDFDEREAALMPQALAASKGAVDYSQHQEILATVLDGLRQHRIVELTYTAHNRREGKSMDVAPLQLVSHRDALYLKGRREKDLGSKNGFYDPTLAIQRIQHATLTDRTFTPPKPTKTDAYSVFGFMPGEPFKIVVEAEARVVPYLKERTWSHDQLFEDLEEGRVRLTFSATSEDEVVSWVLGFAGKMVLLEPVGVRNRIGECGEGIRDAH